MSKERLQQTIDELKGALRESGTQRHQIIEERDKLNEEKDALENEVKHWKQQHAALQSNVMKERVEPKEDEAPALRRKLGMLRESHDKLAKAHVTLTEICWERDRTIKELRDRCDRPEAEAALAGELARIKSELSSGETSSGVTLVRLARASGHRGAALANLADSWVDAWHDLPSDEVPALRVTMGLTWDEYDAWIKKPEALDEIVESKKNGTPIKKPRVTEDEVFAQVHAALHEAREENEKLKELVTDLRVELAKEITEKERLKKEDAQWVMDEELALELNRNAVAKDYFRLRRVIVDVVRKLPACDVCPAPATHAYRRGEDRWCWAHKPEDCPPYPREQPMTVLLCYLGASLPEWIKGLPKGLRGKAS